MRHSVNSGFSLIQLSIVLIVGGLILAATLPGLNSGSTLARTKITTERMERIEAALQNFMAENQRLPYPADLTAAFNLAAFGAEITVPTSFCTSPTTHFTATNSSGSWGTTQGSKTLSATTTNMRKGDLLSGTYISSNTYIDTITSSAGLTMSKPSATTNNAASCSRSPVVAGAVPVKALGLSNEDAIDGFGRRIIYMIDARAAVTETCTDLQNNHRQGAISLSRTSSFGTDVYDYAMWALLSHGPDGQGGTGAQGASLTSRIKTGNVDASTLVNAFYDSSQNKSVGGLGLVNKSPTSTFDDIVWVSQKNKNTCARGEKLSSKKDFRINAVGSTTDFAPGAVFGDINGDGWQDMIIGAYGSNIIRVIFGRKNSWPEPNSAFDGSSLDGSNGFSITRGGETSTTGFGRVIAIGDVNGDGFDDIIASGRVSATTNASIAVIFGRGSFPSSVAISDGNYAIRISGMAATSVNAYIAVGDVNGDGYDDFAFPFYNGAKHIVGLLYGKSSWSSIDLASGAYLTGVSPSEGAATGVRFTVSVPTATSGEISFGNSAGNVIDRRLIAMCDINNDGADEILIPGIDQGGLYTPQRIFAVKGVRGGEYTDDATYPGRVDLLTYRSLELRQNGPFSLTSAGSGYAWQVVGFYCEDINNDGYDDVISYLVNRADSTNQIFYLYNGASTAVPAGNAASNTVRDMAEPDSSPSNAGYINRFTSEGGKPTWSNGITNLVIGDVNNDGKKDIVFVRERDHPYVSTSGTTFNLNITATGTQRLRSGTNWVYLQNPTTSWGTKAQQLFMYGANIRFVGGVADDSLALSAIRDINKDGKNDLLFGSGLTPQGGYIVWGKSSFPSAPTIFNYDANCMRNKTGATHCPTQNNLE